MFTLGSQSEKEVSKVDQWIKLFIYKENLHFSFIRVPFHMQQSFAKFFNEYSILVKHIYTKKHLALMIFLFIIDFTFVQAYKHVLTKLYDLPVFIRYLTNYFYTIYFGTKLTLFFQNGCMHLGQN
ncbi:hypothetical protein ACJX0J_014302 [Zea mays]